MSAFIDARCKCGAHVGWFGSMADRPACKECGHRPPQEELEAADRRINEFTQRTTTPVEQQAQALWRRVRLDAGLSLWNAASLLDISTTQLSAIETGSERLSEEIAKRMNVAFGITKSQGGEA